MPKIPIVSPLVRRWTWAALGWTNRVWIWFLYYLSEGAPASRATWKRARRAHFIVDWACSQDARHRTRTEEERHARKMLLEEEAGQPFRLCDSLECERLP